MSLAVTKRKVIKEDAHSESEYQVGRVAEVVDQESSGVTRAERAAGRNPACVLFWRNIGPYHLARAAAAQRWLARRDERVVLVELAGREKTRDWRVLDGGDRLEWHTLGPDVDLGHGRAKPHFVQETKALLNQLRPQTVAVAGYNRPEMLCAMKWARRHGATVILMSETKWDDRSRPWWKRIVTSRWLRLVDAVLVSGAASGEYLVALGVPRQKVFRQYGVVDNALFASPRRAPFPKQGDRKLDLPGEYFVACSRLIENRKNLKRLMLAYEAYRSTTKTKPWSLVVCGDGEDRVSLEALVRERGIEGVSMPGFLQVHDLAVCYAGAQCFVHAATNEAWGLVVNEAMAAGLPVLVSRRCGCAYDLVRDGLNGYTFDPNDQTELTRLMCRMSEMDAESRTAMGDASRRIVADWGPDRFAEGLVQAIDSCQAGLP